MGDWFPKQTLGSLPERAARRLGTREALYFQGRRWSFTELSQGVDRLARGLTSPQYVRARRTALDAEGGGHHGVPSLTFGELIDRAAERWPEREALWFEGRRWSFAELRDEVDRAAKALIAAGVAPGDHVCLWLGNRPEYVFLFFAIAKIGAVLVPINTRFRTRDMAYIVDAVRRDDADRRRPRRTASTTWR